MCLGLQVSCMICTAATSGLVCSIFSIGKGSLYIMLHFSIILHFHKVVDFQETEAEISRLLVPGLPTFEYS